MNLLKPMVLEKAKTEALNMVPTKEFFKPVLVLVAPLTYENAQLLRCDYLFDANKNPHQFEGTHRPEGELSGAFLQLGGLMVGKTELVGRFGVFLEKKELQLRLRSHLLELKKEALVDLFGFLSSLNKEGYSLTVTDTQGSLLADQLGGSAAKPAPAVYAIPDDVGLIAVEYCNSQPFSAKKLKASIYTAQIDDELFAWGWMLDCSFHDAVIEKKIPNSETACTTHSLAVEKAAYDLFFQVQKSVQGTTPGEGKSRDALIEFLVDLVPGLEQAK